MECGKRSCRRVEGKGFSTCFISLLDSLATGAFIFILSTWTLSSIIFTFLRFYPSSVRRRSATELMVETPFRVLNGWLIWAIVLGGLHRAFASRNFRCPECS